MSATEPPATAFRIATKRAALNTAFDSIGSRFAAAGTGSAFRRGTTMRIRCDTK